MLYRDGFELGTVLKMSPLKWDVSQPPKMFIAKDIIHKSQRYQISRYNILLKKSTKQYTPLFTHIKKRLNVKQPPCKICRWWRE